MSSDEYKEFMELWNDTYEDTSEPSYVVSESVILCDATDINSFGAKFMPMFYYINFLLSYLGNGLVLFILYKFEKLNTVTNIFLLNLVLSNILFASSLPFWATYHKSEWIFGRAVCKMVSSAYFIGFYSSILFLTLMTFDRYLAVVHAVAAAKGRRKSYAVGASVAVWVVSILASLKELVMQDAWPSANGWMCSETGYTEEVMRPWRMFSYYQQIVGFFLLPLLMVMYCYASIAVRILSTRMKEKCRAIKLIFIIVFTFFACWTPYNMVILLRLVRLSSNAVKDAAWCAADGTMDYALYVTRNVAYLYCCISPVFYTFVGKKFQSHFRRLLARRIPCLKRHLSLSSQSSRTTSQKTPHVDRATWMTAAREAEQSSGNPEASGLLPASPGAQCVNVSLSKTLDQ